MAASTREMGVRRSVAGVAVLGALLAVPAWAAPPPLPPRPAPHAAPVWTVDKAASRVSFRALLAGRPVDGVFKRWDVQLAFDPANLRASRLTAVVQADSAVTGQPGRDQALSGPDWLATRRFPRATFTSRVITAAGPGRYLAAGDLTLRGVARPVVLPLTVQVVRDKMRLDATFPLDRGVFGVGQQNWRGGDVLALPVQVAVRLSAVRAK